MNLNCEFVDCLEMIDEYGYDIQPRGLKCREQIGYQITLENPRDRIVTLPSRDLKFRYLLAEFIWYLSGDPQSESIAKYAPFWRQIADDAGQVNSNYGYRLLGYAPASLMPYNQWENVKSLLLKDRDTRQAMMHINLPFDYTRPSKDVPCTLNLQWFIRDNRLILCVNMRSNDIILGFCNDVFQFTMMQEMMLCELNQHPGYENVELGDYIHTAGSMHLYETHFEMAAKCLAENPMENVIVMKPMVFNDQIKQDLIAYEKDWRLVYNCAKEDYSKPVQYARLPDYWKELIDVCFGGKDRSIICS